MTDLRLDVDSHGFPRVALPGETVAFSLWPLTKVQLELFLADEPDSAFGAAWYGQIRALNGRITAREIQPDNFWQTFATGLLPDEALRLANWHGDHYRLPGAEKWAAFYRQALKLDPLLPDRLEKLSRLSPRAHEIAERLRRVHEKQARKAFSLADQMFLRFGIAEWVERADGGWGLMGEPFPKFCGTLWQPEQGKSVELLDRAIRQPCAGLRLAFDRSEGN